MYGDLFTGFFLQSLYKIDWINGTTSHSDQHARTVLPSPSLSASDML